MPIQKYNDKAIDLQSAVFQRRDEAQFAISKAIGAINMLPGIVGNWPMSGVTQYAITDFSGNGYSLARYGATGIGTGPTTGLQGIAQYADFDGTNDYLYHPDVYDFRPTNRFSVGGWFKFDTLNKHDTLISKWRNGVLFDRVFALFKGAGNTIYFGVSSMGSWGTTVLAQTTETVVANQWYFISGYFVGSTTIAVCLNKSWTRTTIGVPATAHAGTADFAIARCYEATWSNLDGKSCLCWMTNHHEISESGITSIYEQTRSLLGI